MTHPETPILPEGGSLEAAGKEARPPGEPNEVARRIRQQEVFMEFTKRALSEIPLENLFQEAIDRVAETLQMRFGRVFEIQTAHDGEKSWRVRAATAAFENAMINTLIPKEDEAVHLYALQRDEPVIVQDFSSETRFPYPTILRDKEIRSGLVTVIHGNTRPFGTMTIGDASLSIISPEDARFVQSLANVLGIVIERRQAEADALAAEERYRLVLDGSNDGLYDWDLEHEHVFWSDQYYRMLGLEPGEIDPNYENFIGLIHPDDREAVAAAIQGHLETREKYAMEYRIRHKDGHYLNIICRGRTNFDDSGKPVRLAGLVRDITFERGVEHAVRESEERFRSIADSAPIAIYMVGDEAQVTYWNKYWLEFTGQSQEQALGKGWSEVMHPDDLEGAYALYMESFNAQKAYEHEIRMRNLSGEYRWFFSKGGPRYLPGGEFAGFVGTMVDITDRKRAESRMSRMVRSNIIGTVFWNRAGSIVDANDAFLEMIGYTRSELEEGKVNWRAMTPPEFDYLDEQAFKEMAEHGVCLPYEKQYLHKDGRRIDIQLGIALMEDTPDEGVAYIMDITERKQVQLALEDSVARERLNRRILEVISQPVPIETILHEVAEEVGRFFDASRCLVITYEEQEGGYDMALTGQFSKDPQDITVNLDQIDPEVMKFITRNLRAEHVLRDSVTNSPDEYLAQLETRLNQMPLTPEEKSKYLEYFGRLTLEYYRVKATMQVSIAYQGRPYGSISVQQCDRERQWKDDEVALLKNIANHMGLAMFQAELFQQEQQASRQLQHSNNLMDIISSAQNLFISNEDIYDLFEQPLNRLLDHTASEYGFIGEILHTPEGNPYLKCNFLTNIAWDEATRKLYEESRKTGFEFHKLDNLFGLVITTGEVVISNDPDNDPRGAGRPDGHPPLKSFLGIPFSKNDQLVGMVGIANRPGGYDEVVVKELQPFVDACANIIVGYRNERLREQLTHDLKVSERALKIYAAKLERSNRELEQFATVASHDLQAPLRKVVMFSDFLQQAADKEQLSEDSRDYLERIQKATRRMQALITDLLSLSRVHRKGQPFRQVDLSLLTREALTDLDELMLDTQGTVNIGELPTIDCDMTQMQQLMTNLIGNALKFHRKGVPPVVEVTVQIIDDRMCEITIRDNGIGFEEKYVDRIFDVFERLHGETEYEGTGIGLAICSKIVERHGGTIVAESRPGNGSAFIVQLPIRQPRTASSEE